MGKGLVRLLTRTSVVKVVKVVKVVREEDIAHGDATHVKRVFA
jgi:hypothetical protein